MHKTKVLHITYDMRIGGTEMVIKNIINGCDKNKIEMSILCIESPLGPFAKDLQAQGIQFYQLDRQAGFDKKLISNIRSVIKDEAIDIIHCHQYTPWVYGVIAAAFFKTKVIFTEHGRFYPDSSTWKRKLINPILNYFTDKVTAISQATKHALVEFENIPLNDIEVIYNGISPLHINIEKAEELKESLNIPENNIILGTVARFDPIKNHSMMLHAFSQVLIKHPNTTLIIVGDGDERENIEQCINHLRLKDNVILTGYKAKPAEHIAIMDIFLLSSLSEGTSMTLLEAMSIGKPCVVTNAGGNPEIIKNKANGLVTQNDNSEQFEQAISHLIEHKNDISKMKRESFTRFETMFTSKIMAKHYDDIYCEYQKHAYKDNS